MLSYSTVYVTVKGAWFLH